jgi:predicted translin family RNA/ssDNA-binding protein
MADVSMSAEPSSSSIQDRFQAYSKELDEHYDRRERIIKTSRDITALSKKAIFNLHRITQSRPDRVLKESKAKLDEIRDLIASLQQDLEGERYWRLD